MPILLFAAIPEMLASFLFEDFKLTAAYLPTLLLPTDLTTLPVRLVLLRTTQAAVAGM